MLYLACSNAKFLELFCGPPVLPQNITHVRKKTFPKKKDQKLANAYISFLSMTDAAAFLAPL